MAKSNKLQKFEITLGHAEFASEQLWQIFQMFILTHTILIALLGNILFRVDGQVTLENKLPLKLILGIGLSMSIMWLGAYFRTRGYYDFRLAQASEIEPKELKLLKERGKNFAEGKCVQVENKHYRMNCLARLLRMRWTMPIFILLFSLFYIILFLQDAFK